MPVYNNGSGYSNNRNNPMYRMQSGNMGNGSANNGSMNNNANNGMFNDNMYNGMNNSFDNNYPTRRRNSDIRYFRNNGYTCACWR